MEGVINIIKKSLLRYPKSLFERVKTLAKEEGISINKMLIKLIELGIFKYIEGGMIKSENDTK